MVAACVVASAGQPVQPIEPVKVKPPIIPPKHPKTPAGDRPVDRETAKPPEGARADGPAPLPYPFPLITEVLYAVPAGEKGDANRDSNRHAAGDEFVEIVNPHDKSIQIKGYTVTDRNPPAKGQLKFTFPALELPPGGVVVVFNGCEQGWGKGEEGSRIVGDGKTPPQAGNPNFFGAYVFTVKNTSSRTSWNNGGDYVLLSDAAGNPVHCVHWGEFSEPVPAATLVEHAPTTSKSSVQRVSLAGPFTSHMDLASPEPAGDSSQSPSSAQRRLEKGRLFSPGWFDAGDATGREPEPPKAKQPAAPARDKR